MGRDWNSSAPRRSCGGRVEFSANHCRRHLKMPVRTKRWASRRPQASGRRASGRREWGVHFFNELPGSFLQIMRFEDFCPSLWINERSFSPGFQHLCFAKPRSGFERPRGRMPCGHHGNPWLGTASFLWVAYVLVARECGISLIYHSDRFRQEKAVTPSGNGRTRAFGSLSRGSAPPVTSL